MHFERRALVFMALLPFSFVFFAIAWLIIAPGHLYYCWDDAPPFVISWCPPFIHPWADSADGKLRDYFIWPAWSVYLVWISFLAGVFLVPALGAWKFVKRGNDEAG
jgi:hypothetical protein